METDDGYSRIGSDPFASRPEERDPARRLRGRLSAPVTVWTASDAAGRPAGLTVSSVLVAEGDPPEVLGLVDSLSSFWDAVQESGRFVLQILTSGQARMAEQFALRFPGDPFAGEEVTSTPWGPALGAVSTRAGCTLTASVVAGYSLLVRATVDEIVLQDPPARPLVHYRGAYLATGPPRVIVP